MAPIMFPMDNPGFQQPKPISEPVWPRYEVRQAPGGFEQDGRMFEGLTVQSVEQPRAIPVAFAPYQLFRDEAGNTYICPTQPSFQTNQIKPIHQVLIPVMPGNQQPSFIPIASNPQPQLITSHPQINHAQDPFKAPPMQYVIQAPPPPQPQYVYSPPTPSLPAPAPKPEKPQENKEKNFQMLSGQNQKVSEQKPKAQNSKEQTIYISDTKIGAYGIEERKEKIQKYKKKLEKWREKHPIVKSFEGRKMVAVQKPRVRGKFVKADEPSANSQPKESSEEIYCESKTD